jgi:hypothetical protein
LTKANFSAILDTIILTCFSMSPELGLRRNSEISNKEVFSGNVDKMVEKRLPMFREDFTSVDQIDAKLKSLTFEGSEADINDMRATEIALLKIREELTLNAEAAPANTPEVETSLNEGAIQSQLEAFTALYEKRSAQDARKSIEKRLNAVSKEVVELASSGPDEELNDVLVEQAALERMLESLPQETARLATAYGGSIAASEVGSAKQEAQQDIKITNVDQSEVVNKLLNQQKELWKKKIDAGMNVEDALAVIENEIDNANEDIEELGDDQELMIKQAMDKLKVNEALKSWIENEEYKRAA